MLSVKKLDEIAHQLDEGCLGPVSRLSSGLGQVPGGRLAFFSSCQHRAVVSDPGGHIFGGGGVVVALEADDMRPSGQTACFYHAIPGGCKQNQIAGQGRLDRLGVPFEQGLGAVNAQEQGVLSAFLGQVAVNETGAANISWTKGGAGGLGDQVHAQIETEAGPVEVQPGLQESFFFTEKGMLSVLIDEKGASEQDQAIEVDEIGSALPPDFGHLEIDMQCLGSLQEESSGRLPFGLLEDKEAVAHVLRTPMRRAAAPRRGGERGSLVERRKESL